MDRIANESMRNRIPSRIWLLGLISLVAIATVVCGSADATSPSDSAIAQVSARGSGESTGNAPSITGETFSHGEFSLELNDGKPILVNFWFPSCPPCRAEMPDLQAAYEKYGEDVAFIGIQQLGLDSAANGEAFVKELGLTYPSMPDLESKVQFGYEVFSFPTTVFLNKNHDIARTWNGIIGEDQLAEQLEALIAS